MTWWERWAFNALHVFVAATGVVYFCMKYMMTTDDPFSVVNHPWQPAMLSAHVISVPLFIVFFGMLFRSHSFPKIRSPHRANRRTGWMSLISFSAMTASGYLLQVASSSVLITVLIWTHVTTSALFVAGYGIHLVIGWRVNQAKPDLVRVITRRRRRMRTKLNFDACRKIDRFLTEFAAALGWNDAMTNRIRAVGEETLLVLIQQEEHGDTWEGRRVVLTARSQGNTAELEFIVAAADTNIEDKMDLIEEPVAAVPVEKGVSLRLLRHFASSVLHRQYRDRDVVTARVEWDT